jgi:hypothetical protein
VRQLRAVRRLFLVSSFALALWLLLLLLARHGGVEGPGIHLSAYRRDWPAAAAGALAFIYLALARRRIREDIDWAGARFEARASWVAGLAAICAGGAAVIWGTHTAGSADAYGYVSQADLWLRGQLVVRQPFAAQFAWSDLVFAPLGYRPGLEPRTIVPTYPPGLPMFMAAAKLAVGPCGVYAVVPASAVVVILATYGLGARVWSRSAGAAAALLVACSPAMVFMSMSPMSDVPVSAAWAVAIVCLLRRSVAATVAAGFATAATVLIRPNLVPLAMVGAIVVMQSHWRDGSRRALARAIVYGLGILPAIVAIAWLNNHLYGSPLMSGHGDLGPHFAWRNGPINACLYTSWLMQTQTPVILFALVPLAVALLRLRDRPSAPALVLLYGTIATVAASYLFFRPFDDWWWLRYWLPAFPPLLVMTIAGASIVLRRVRTGTAAAVGIIGVVAVAALQLHVPIRAGIFTSPTTGTRFQAFGRYVNEHTPANAVILAMEHSGSLRYYGGRMTLRYDWLDDLDAAVRELSQAGYQPYLALDESERAGFERRFLPRSRLARLDWAPAIELLAPVRVRLYDLLNKDASVARIPLRGTRRSCAPAASRVYP